MIPGDCVLGIDPGIESLGWGVAVVGPDGKLYYKAHGCSKTLATQSMPVRIDQQCATLSTLIEKYRPTVISVEAWVPYAGGRSGAGANTMRMCGAVRCIGAVLAKVRVVEYTAQAVKGILMGDRGADKGAVQLAVQQYFGMGKLPRPNHAADALACCVAHFVAQASHKEVTSKSVKYRANSKRKVGASDVT